jgi:4-amino-4-deoxy-L-arabinose transferase-like glycosyltransferase
MWLYPLPALVALIGWIYVATAPEQRENIGTALILLLLGIGAYFLWARTTKVWPFAPTETGTTIA